MDKMHHMSNVGVGGRTELGLFCLPAPRCCRCQAGCQWLSKEVNAQDILDCQKQVMFSFAPALFPIERA